MKYDCRVSNSLFLEIVDGAGKLARCIPLDLRPIDRDHAVIDEPDIIGDVKDLSEEVFDRFTVLYSRTPRSADEKNMYQY